MLNYQRVCLNRTWEAVLPERVPQCQVFAGLSQQLQPEELPQEPNVPSLTKKILVCVDYAWLVWNCF